MVKTIDEGAGKDQGRKRGRKPKTDPNVGLSDKDLAIENKVDLKGKLTLKEIKFLEIYLQEDTTIENAMILAGYTDCCQKTRYRTATKIVQKYEMQGDDTRKIFRDIGFGQVKIAQGIKTLAEEAKSEMVRLNALALAAKCTRMTQEPEPSHTGVQIVIACQEPRVREIPPGHIRPASYLIEEEKVEKDKPTKPLQITK